MAYVLVVEDDHDLSYIYHTVLARAGHDVAMARSGKEARQALEARVPDLMFLDINMPDESGIDILEMVRADERLEHLQVVVVTANKLWQRKIGCRVERFLVKPVSITEIVDAAAALVP